MDAAAVAAALREGSGVRVVAGGTKLGWGRPIEAPELSVAELDAIVEHNVGDLTAILQAGCPLARAREAFAAAGQMLALDPPDDGATIGGVVATGDSGPPSDTAKPVSRANSELAPVSLDTTLSTGTEKEWPS